MLCSGEELAEAAGNALGTKMEFENVSESVAAIRYITTPSCCREQVH